MDPFEKIASIPAGKAALKKLIEGFRASTPFGAAKNLGMDVLYGRKASSGPFAGKRVSPVKGIKGLTPIHKGEYEAIKNGKPKGTVHSIKTPEGDQYFKRRYERGGVTGFAKRRPFVAAGIGAAGLLLASSGSARDAASGMLPQVPPNTISPMVEQNAGQPVSTESPLNRNVWG